MPPAVRSSPAASQNSFREVSKSSVAWLICFDARKPLGAVRWRTVCLFSSLWWLEVKVFRRTQVRRASSTSDFEEKNDSSFDFSLLLTIQSPRRDAEVSLVAECVDGASEDMDFLCAPSSPCLRGRLLCQNPSSKFCFSPF